MATRITKITKYHEADTENEANEIIEEFKDHAAREGYTVTETKVDYKTKKNRKTHEIEEEWYNVKVTIAYDV